MIRSKLSVPKKPDAQGGGTVALIQSNPADARVITDAFARKNRACPLLLLKDGEEALAYFSGFGQYSDRSRYPLPSVILCDLNLPGMSGFDVLSWLRERAPLVVIPVVMLSSSRQPQDIQRSYALGAWSYFVQPLSEEQLASLVRAVSETVVLRPSPLANTRKRSAPIPLIDADGNKRIVVGSSSENTHIRLQQKYRVRIGKDWHVGTFSKQWFGWKFDDVGPSGLQLNLIDEVFEIPGPVFKRRPIRRSPEVPAAIPLPANKLPA